MKISDNSKHPQNTILHTDCVEFLEGVAEPFADLVFADPPFNIGYQYDVYHDNRDYETYLEWTKRWMRATCRALKPDGTFWVAIGDEYAAEIKLIAQKDVGLACRSWVIWYYTFGVNCTRKFTRSHAHLFHFVRDSQKFTFRGEDLENRVPSARQLVYNDKRANPSGRLPDDTWAIRPANVVGELICDDGTWDPTDLSVPSDETQTWSLRPQDLSECFTPTENTWYFPRVAGTFKERAGFHGCQMPEQLLGRIIRTCSNEKDLVLDPFSGSGTTLAVAKKLGRRYLGFDVSEDYVKYGMQRLDAIRFRDPLDGSVEPLLTAPKTQKGQGASGNQSGRHLKTSSKRRSVSNTQCAERKRYNETQLAFTLVGVLEAFRGTYDGYSADRVVADPNLNHNFVEECNRLSLAGDARTWNILLFRLRKAGKLIQMPTTRRTVISWEECDDYLFASEIALQLILLGKKAQSLDEVLCDPSLAREFDEKAARFAPRFRPLEYRWAALKLRRQARLARSRGAIRKPPRQLGKMIPVQEIEEPDLPDSSGVYVLSENGSSKIYVGKALNLRNRLSSQFRKSEVLKAWNDIADSLQLQTFVTELAAAEMLAWQSCLVRKYEPRLNFQ